MHSSSANAICRPNKECIFTKLCQLASHAFCYTPLHSESQSVGWSFLVYLTSFWNIYSLGTVSFYFLSMTDSLIYCFSLGQVIGFVVYIDSKSSTVVNSMFQKEMIVWAILLDDEAPFEPFPHSNFLWSSSASCYLFTLTNITVGIISSFTKKKSAVTQPCISLLW